MELNLAPFAPRPDVLRLTPPADQLDLFGPDELEALLRVTAHVADQLGLPDVSLTYDGRNLDVTHDGRALVTLSARLNPVGEVVVTGAFPRQEHLLVAVTPARTGTQQQALLIRRNARPFSLGRVDGHTGAFTDDTALLKVRAVGEHLRRVLLEASSARAA
ncbi:hypothetical protein [Deinococcus soli (ex Cha et al. 2016)]|uniref:Uncharacterized protein n=2 Tax=Deinococcus soli (ex Cha et al. 2016) TaxID=1309411 RepID=A0ACC6KKS3_9DEIO|nr:hypothetical protein [Deinococcus soli (ex Cha et al. 2016)]MDR6218697.1 hypothetical protein [Deinococcus soli (ex Cha et al. 2016)]MDR6328494.1 hypothetical protein [Deinococcus soli (ex Cha et al. 2016)]MDR6753105.1 hypothetical protein [Deinococcus soli (ex Cha et al. 2016)]